EAEQDNEKNGLNGGGNKALTKIGAVMDEQIAIAEKARRRGQYLRHVSPLQSSNATRSLRATPIHCLRSSPPLSLKRIAHCASAKRTCSEMVNKFNRSFAKPGRVVRLLR